MAKGKNSGVKNHYSQMLDFIERAGEQAFLRELARMGIQVAPLWLVGEPEPLAPEEAVVMAATLRGVGMVDAAEELLESLIAGSSRVAGEA
jgi:hypothetical protein